MSDPRIEDLLAEIEQLRSDRNQMADAYREAAADIERLRRALQEIADYPHNGRTETMLLRGHARSALEPKT